MGNVFTYASLSLISIEVSNHRLKAASSRILKRVADACKSMSFASTLYSRQCLRKLIRQSSSVAKAEVSEERTNEALRERSRRLGSADTTPVPSSLRRGWAETGGRRASRPCRLLLSDDGTIRLEVVVTPKPVS